MPNAKTEKSCRAVMVPTVCSRRLDFVSEGYRKTLVKEVRVSLPANDGTPAGKAKAVAIAASEHCSGALKELDFEVRSGVVRIPPISGWAGISIAMLHVQAGDRGEPAPLAGDLEGCLRRFSCSVCVHHFGPLARMVGALMRARRALLFQRNAGH